MADSNGSNGGNGIDANDILGIVALIVSLIALLGTVAQVLQQYYASAAGYTNCDEKVMGKWHESKQRIFRYYELRFEVQFESPVIFVAPPDNTSGPVPDSSIHYIKGTPQSLIDTRTLLPVENRKKQEELVSRAKHVHTADNERATWVTLLSELQSMEKESQEWQTRQYHANPPTNKPQATFDNHRLAVAIQSKKRSWDTMPSTVKKPYATTTICHLVEIVAMLGLHWKEFNRSTDRYRAEGNGYMLTGTKVDDLGIMFTFQIYGKSRFKENRVIPMDEVKELCFGYFSTIFRKGKDGRRLDFPDEEPSDLSILQVGSTNDMAETLVLIGCNTNTANYFRSDATKHSHLFPVAFELIGMLGMNLHIPNSCYRMLPNPTPYHWDKKFFSLRKLLKEFEKKLKDDDVGPNQTDQVQRLSHLAEEVNEKLRAAPQDFSTPLLDSLNGAIGSCDTFLLRKDVSRELVTMVLREHFQEVLRMINDADAADDGAAAPTLTHAAMPSISPISPATGGGTSMRPPRFDDLNAASPELKQKQFMDIYFTVVLPRVLRQAVEALQRRHTTNYAPSHHGRDPSTGSAYSPPTSPIAPASQPPAPTPQQDRTRSNSQTLRVEIGDGVEMRGLSRANSDISLNQSPRGRDQGQMKLETQASDIWCTLVFRMLCWLLLHDFHKKDVQISKSELLGSRLPVYIA